jgi:hypothetical protein
MMIIIMKNMILKDFRSIIKKRKAETQPFFKTIQKIMQYL